MSYCSHQVLIPIALCLLWGGFPCGTVAQTRQLTDDGTMKFTPTFFRDDNEVAFVQFAKPTLFQIISLKLDDLSVRPLHENESNHELDLAISPDGAYYAYIKCHGTLTGSIEILDANQNQIGTVPPGEGFGIYRSLAFAPNNSRLLFSYPEEVHQQIFSVGLKGDNRQQLTNSSGINNWPCFSPDGSLIAFGSTRDGNYEIYTMQSDGTGVRRLTNSPTMDMRPKFSPDGQRICFTSNRDGNYEIYVMNFDGSDLQRITDHPERDDYATWHPNGKQLLMVSERSGNHDLYFVELPR
jgi:Tol biopolymer transport system component